MDVLRTSPANLRILRLIPACYIADQRGILIEATNGVEYYYRIVYTRSSTYKTSIALNRQRGTTEEGRPQCVHFSFSRPTGSVAIQRSKMYVSHFNTIYRCD